MYLFAIVDTSLEFRSPHMRTHEQLHHRLKRVLSSVSNSAEHILEDEAYHPPPSHYRRKDHWRTKSMPSGVKEFMESMNSADTFDERSKSVEVLNHQRGNSAFRLYTQEEGLHEVAVANSGVFDVEDPTHSWMSVTEDHTESSEIADVTMSSQPDVFDITDATLDDDERFIDSPAVVDYQLGLRKDLPHTTSPAHPPCDTPDAVNLPHPPANSLRSPAIQSPVNTHYIEHPLNAAHCSDSDDDEIIRTLDRKNTHSTPEKHAVSNNSLTLGSDVVHATPVMLGTPVQQTQQLVVHATPIMLGTPCELGERKELKVFRTDQVGIIWEQ